jgi:hypothetical protein
LNVLSKGQPHIVYPPDPGGKLRLLIFSHI